MQFAVNKGNQLTIERTPPPNTAARKPFLEVKRAKSLNENITTFSAQIFFGSKFFQQNTFSENSETNLVNDRTANAHYNVRDRSHN